jgi:hypothetical protein
MSLKVSLWEWTLWRRDDVSSRRKNSTCSANAHSTDGFHERAATRVNGCVIRLETYKSQDRTAMDVPRRQSVKL